MRTCRLFIINIAIFIAAFAVFSYVSTLFNHETLFFLFILSFKPRSNIMTPSWYLNIRLEYSFAASAIDDQWLCVTIVSHRNIHAYKAVTIISIEFGTNLKKHEYLKFKINLFLLCIYTCDMEWQASYSKFNLI